MATAKELLALKLKQNTQKHQFAQKDNIKELKEFRRNVPIGDISRSPYQPRRKFDDQEIKKLAESIDEVGLLQPITVRKLENLKFELIAGERRLRAHEILNKSTIEAIIIDASNEEASLLTLAENLKREDLTDFEIYIGLVGLDENVKKNKQRLAKSLGLNREDMYKYLAFEKLPKSVLNDLGSEPQLLGRSAATSFKKFLSDHNDNYEIAELALLHAWDKVKRGQLEQTKAVLQAEKYLIQDIQESPSTSLVKKIEYAGKVAGNIKFNDKLLKVSLKISQFDDASLKKLENLLKEFVEKNEKV